MTIEVVQAYGRPVVKDHRFKRSDGEGLNVVIMHLDTPFWSVWVGDDAGEGYSVEHPWQSVVRVL